MAGGAEKLSVAKIRAARPHPKKTTASGSGPRWAKYGDGKGLWLMVGPNGNKHWRFIYTMDKQTRHLSLGEVDPSDIPASVEAARAKAREYREMTRLGIDPRLKLEAEKAERRGAILASLGQRPDSGIPTFQALAERYMRVREEKSDMADKTIANWRGTMRDYIFPAIGGKPVNEVTIEDVLAILKPLWKAKDQGGKPEIAARVRSRIGTVLTMAASFNYRDDDRITRPAGPLDFELGNRPKGKNHDAMDYADIPAFMGELRVNGSGFAPRALELLIMTAARTGEVLEATWSEIDLEKKVWAIPGERMKMGRDHVVPLSEPALALLNCLPRDIGSAYVFPSPNKAKAPLSNMAMTNVLKRMGRKDGVTVHGFRSTFRTWAAEQCLDLPSDVAEAALAHIKGGVEGVYNRGTHLETRRDLMARWGAFVGGAA